MAEKSFGVKEVNLIGASGTPTITSPNNLNLNAVNVAISTNVSIGGTLSVSGGISIGGTLTYEDVINVDSIGIVTARTGLVSPYADIDDFVDVGSNIQLGNAGVVTATTFSGSAASLTSIPAANITGTLPAISGANLTGITVTSTTSDIQVVYEITNQTSFTYYRFAGNGVDSSADDPDLYLMRGFKYRFINNSGGSHPFKIRTFADASTSSDTYNYNTGVTGQGNSSGNIDFAVPYDAPAVLYYQCGSHSSMFGKIYIRGAGGQNDNVGFTTFSQGIDIDDAAASEKWTIVNNSANTLRFMRGTTTDFSFGPSGQLGLGGWAASAYGSEGQVARSNSSSGGSPEWASSIYYPSVYKDYDPTGVSGFTNNSFPSWVEKITIIFHRVSFTGSDNILFQFRNSSGDVTSGYFSYTRNATASYTNTSTAGFIIGTTSLSQETSGTMEIYRVANLKWTSTHLVTVGSSNMRDGAGQLTISGTIPTGWFIGASGTDTFDGNSRISITYQ
tara:strand:+ start:5044 stop:6555 length:1512 start_codon:yes stop_codon:yes gene_type:complete